MKILLADDEPDILRLYREMLEGSGYEVATATDGREALDRFAAGDFDLVVMDLHMPNLNGSECIAEMQKQRPDVPVIVMTGYYPDDAVADQFRELGLEVPYTLRKPVTITTMWNAISHVQAGEA